MIESILQGNEASVAALAELSERTWTALFDHVAAAKSRFAPASLIDEMLRQDAAADRWLRRAAKAQAICGIGYVDVEIEDCFVRWLCGGLARFRGTDVDVLFQVRLWQLRDHPRSAHQALADGRALLGQAAAGRLDRGIELGQLLMLVGRRALEAGAHEDALAASEEAEAIFAGIDDEAQQVRCVFGFGHVTQRALAGRQRGAALFRLERFDEAFAVVEPLFDQSLGVATGGGVFRSLPGKGPRQDATAEAATVAAWAGHATPTWVVAVGGLATRYSDRKLGDTHHGPALWAHFERAVWRMRDEAIEDPYEAWDTLIRQANQRRYRKLVAEADRIAAAHAEGRRRPEAQRPIAVLPREAPGAFLARMTALAAGAERSPHEGWAALIGDPDWDKEPDPLPAPAPAAAGSRPSLHDPVGRLPLRDSRIAEALAAAGFATVAATSGDEAGFRACLDEYGAAAIAEARYARARYAQYVEDPGVPLKLIDAIYLQPVSELGLSGRLAGLVASEVRTLAEVVTRSRSDWLETRGFGRASYERLVEYLNARRLTLGVPWSALSSDDDPPLPADRAATESAEIPAPSAPTDEPPRKLKGLWDFFERPKNLPS